MSLTTRPMRLHLRSVLGNPLPGAKVTLQLSAYQADGIEIVPLVWTLTEDPRVPGDYIGPIWPNTRVDEGTHYDLLVQANEQKLLAHIVTVAEGGTEAVLNLKINPPPYLPVYGAQAATSTANTFANAAGTSATIAAQYAAGLGDVSGAVTAAQEAAQQAADAEVQRLAYEDRVYPGVYSTPPSLKPHSGAASADGDRCVILVGGVPTEHLRSGGGWLIPNFDAQQLAQAATLPMMAFTAIEAQSIFDNALPLQNYTELLAYGGRAKGVRVTGVYGTAVADGISGPFRYNPSAPNTTNGGTRFAHPSGIGAWEREFSGAWYASWFGAAPGVDSTAALTAAIAAMPATGGELRLPVSCDISGTVTLNKPITLVGGGAGVVTNSNTGSVIRKLAALNGAAIVALASGVTCKNFTLQGLAGNAGDGIVVLGARFTLEEVSVFGMGRDGVRLGADLGPSNVNLWAIRNLRSKNNGRHGLHISDKVSDVPAKLADVNAGTLMHADLQANGECGLYLGNSMFDTFVGICAQVNGTYGVFCSVRSSGHFFYGGDFEVNGRPPGVQQTSYADFFIEAGSKNHTVFGGSCFNFPVAFVCNEPENLIIGMRDSDFAGKDRYAGLQLFNIPSDKPTVLDVYDEGNATTTLVPVVKGSTTAGVGTYSLQGGRATRIGNTLTFSLQVGCTGHTGAGNIQVDGLPFVSSAFGFQAVNIVAGDLTTPANSAVAAMVIPNSKTIAVYSVSTAGVATPTPLAMDATMTLRISGAILLA